LNKLYLYHKGTHNPITVWTSSRKREKHPHPILIGEEPPELYITAGKYDAILKNEWGKVLEETV